jgi:hypothetical protein
MCFKIGDELGPSRMMVHIYQAAWHYMPEDHNLIIKIDLREEGCEGVVLTKSFPMANSGDTEMNHKMRRAEVL